MKFTKKQLIMLVDKTIEKETEFKSEDFTGGYISVTSVHKNNQQNYKVALFFGYNNNKSVTRILPIKSDTYSVWSEALQCKVMSLESDNDGISLDDIMSMVDDREGTNSIYRGGTNSTTNSTTNPSTTKNHTYIPIPTNHLPTNHIADNISKFLLEKIKSVNPTFKEPNLNSWSSDIDKAIRIDGRTEEQLLHCIKWIYSDAGSFWQKNILSGKKLREKFDTMNMQVISTKPTKPQKELSENVKAIVKAMKARGHSDDEIQEELRKIS